MVKGHPVGDHNNLVAYKPGPAALLPTKPSHNRTKSAGQPVIKRMGSGKLAKRKLATPTASPLLRSEEQYASSSSASATTPALFLSPTSSIATLDLHDDQQQHQQQQLYGHFDPNLYPMTQHPSHFFDTEQRPLPHQQHQYQQQQIHQQQHQQNHPTSPYLPPHPHLSPPRPRPAHDPEQGFLQHLAQKRLHCDLQPPSVAEHYRMERMSPLQMAQERPAAPYEYFPPTAEPRVPMPTLRRSTMPMLRRAVTTSALEGPRYSLDEQMMEHQRLQEMHFAYESFNSEATFEAAGQLNLGKYQGPL